MRTITRARVRPAGAPHRCRTRAAARRATRARSRDARSARLSTARAPLANRPHFVSASRSREPMISRCASPTFVSTRDIGPRRAHERLEIAVLARAHLDDRDALVAVVEREQEFRDADLVVFVLRRGGHGAAGRLERLRRRTLSSSSCRCCRSPRSPGPRTRSRASAPSARYAASVSATTIAAHAVGQRRPHRRRSPPTRRSQRASRDEAMAVEVLAAQREKRFARPDRARIGRRRRSWPAARSRLIDAFRRARRSHRSSAASCAQRSRRAARTRCALRRDRRTATVPRRRSDTSRGLCPRRRPCRRRAHR